MTLIIDKSLSIPEAEIHTEFVRASGPGGQNVNKVNSAVQLRFDIRQSSSLNEEIKKRLIKLSGRRVTEEEILVIEAKRFRSQLQNRHDAIERLAKLIRKALIPPSVRKKTKPSHAAQKKRMEQKHQRATLKKLRQFDPHNEMQ